jgi:uncharacterized protein (DUF1697 family)
MAALRDLFASLECEDVTTYVQSGNVVFRSSGAGAELSRSIEGLIRRELNLDVSVLVRTKEQLAATVAGNPFAADERDPRKLHVTFLGAVPERALVHKLEAREFEPDEFRIARQEIYLRCPNGYGRSKLSNAFFEKSLDVRATTRNWKTVTVLAERAGD